MLGAGVGVKATEEYVIPVCPAGAQGPVQMVSEATHTDHKCMLQNWDGYGADVQVHSCSMQVLG